MKIDPKMWADAICSFLSKIYSKGRIMLAAFFKKCKGAIMSPLGHGRITAITTSGIAPVSIPKEAEKVIISRHIRAGTRASALARAQTDHVIAELKKKHPELNVEVITVKTTGDAVIDKPLSAAGGKGLFTKEIEDALLAKEIDFAVHSLKDLPTKLPEWLQLGAITVREDPRDALVGASPKQLKEKVTKIGTSSLRRRAQMKRLFPKAKVVDLRGNVDTRLKKVREGVVDCTVLALAGLRRLGLEKEVSTVMDIEDMLPAAAQGAIGIEIRERDRWVRDLLRCINCDVTTKCVTAERAFLTKLGGGCRVPVAALAVIEDGVLHLKGRVTSLDGKRMIEDSRGGPANSAAAIGEHLADILLKRGAGEIIKEARSNTRT